jgi:hypothetical protein
MKPPGCRVVGLGTSVLGALIGLPAIASHIVKEGLEIEDLPCATQKIVMEDIRRGATFRVVHAVPRRLLAGAPVSLKNTSTGMSHRDYY